MNVERVAEIARALLYEGYLLYPYRDSAVKNHHRWMFGTLYPRPFVEEQDEADGWWSQTQCLVRGDNETVLDARVRFLHLATAGALEREVAAPSRPLGRLLAAPETTAFEFAAPEEPGALRGALHVAAERASHGLYRVTSRITNLTPFTSAAGSERAHRRDAALRWALASTHTLLGVSGGEFISPVSPPDEVREVAAACRNVSAWPVLVGEPGARDMVLSAPVILEDYPRVAPESSGDFFDATEIDELLTLRILTLTDEEKQAMHAGDAQARRLLARTETLADAERRRLHGASRTPHPAGARDPALQPGVRVRLTPRRGGDIFDVALAGRTATVVRIEEDYEGRVFVAVTVDDDPGRDLGIDGRPGHRFFFRPDEVERLS